MEAGHDLGQQGLVGRAVAEVLGNGRDQRLLFAEQQLAQGTQPLDALVGAGHRVGAEGFALTLEEALQLADLLLGLLQVGDVGDHGAVPRRLRERRPNPLADAAGSVVVYRWIFRANALICQMACLPSRPAAAQRKAGQGASG
ncbi:hypothetical protein D9M71_508000 [compost metagenome]